MKNNRQTAVRVMIIILALTGAALYMFLGSVSVSIGKDSITVSGTLSKDVTLQYSDIKVFELDSKPDIGVCSFGLCTRRICTGQYSSPVYGPYHLFRYNNVEKLIILRTTDGVLIFNCPTEDETVKCFEEIGKQIHNSVTSQKPEN